MQNYNKLHIYSAALLIVSCALLSTSGNLLIITSGLAIITGTALLPLHISLSIILFLSGAIPQSSSVDKLFLVFEKISFSELALTGTLLRVLTETLISKENFLLKKNHASNFLKIFLFFCLFFILGVAKNGLVNTVTDTRSFYLYLTIIPAAYSAHKNTEKTLQWFVWTIAATSLVICIEFILINRLKAYIPYEYMPDLHDDNRVSLRNGGFFIFSFGILAYLIKSKTSSAPEKTAYFTILLLIFFSSFLAQNRTNIATYMIQILIIHLIGKQVTIKLLATTGAKVVGVVFFIYVLSLLFPGTVFSEVINRFLLALNPEENTDTLIARTSMIAAAWTRFTESPVIGLGLGSKFEIVLLEYDLGVNYYIDNLWVVALCKFGLIGFVPFSIYVYRSIIANPIKASFSRRNLYRHEIYNIYTIMLTGELMMSLTTAMLWVHVASIIPFSILTGILIIHQRRSNENHH